MTSGNRPPAEVHIDDVLVGALLEDQHPDLAGLQIHRAAEGWDNAVYRLGEDLVVRLPRRASSAALLLNEQRWLPRLADALPLAVPVALRVGGPSRSYPWSWSVCPWLPGRTAASSPPSDDRRAGLALGSFIAALHRPAPPEAPLNPYRGGPLSSRHQLLLSGLDRLAGQIDRAHVLATWDELSAAPTWAGPAVWLHGDLHLANVLVDRGEVSAVIDFGDICQGDPATDLVVAWMLETPGRSALRQASGVDDDTWRRGRGWALALAVAMLAASADDPTIHDLGERTLAAVLDERS